MLCAGSDYPTFLNQNTVLTKIKKGLSGLARLKLDPLQG